jgi:hypothetical protein
MIPEDEFGPLIRQPANRKGSQAPRKEHVKLPGLPPLPRAEYLPATARWNAALTTAFYIVASVNQEMDEYYIERTDNWKQSERAVTLLERFNDVTSIFHELEELLYPPYMQHSPE